MRIEAHKPRNSKGNLALTTEWVSEDEPCVELREVERKPNSATGKRRFQVITVMRDGRPTQFARDLGLANLFPTDQIRVVTSVVTGNGAIDCLHTVGEAIEIADYQREEYYMWYNLPRYDWTVGNLNIKEKNGKEN